MDVSCIKYPTEQDGKCKEMVSCKNLNLDAR